MSIKKRLTLFITIVTIVANLSVTLFVGAVFVPPAPIRDSIVEEF